jgi:hypothetical protein
MKASIEVQAEHLGGPSVLKIESDIEPNEAAWTGHTFVAMAKAMNHLLTAVFDERDLQRFEKDKLELRERALEIRKTEEDPERVSDGGASRTKAKTS